MNAYIAIVKMHNTFLVLLYFSLKLTNVTLNCNIFNFDADIMNAELTLNLQGKIRLRLKGMHNCVSTGRTCLYRNINAKFVFFS